MQRILLLIFILTAPTLAGAQKKVLSDTGYIVSRQFSGASMEKYRSDPSFKYLRAGEPVKSLWDRFWEWFWGKLGQLLATESGWNIFATIIVLLASGILLYFILKLTGMTGSRLLGKESKGERSDYSLSGDDIHAIRFDTAIQEAIAAGNYRLAVRLLYLQTLKQLADKGLINWQIDKTNIAYLHELSGNRLFTQFRDLTFQFEKNWYGDLPIREEEFNSVENKFSDFNQQIK